MKQNINTNLLSSLQIVNGLDLVYVQILWGLYTDGVLLYRVSQKKGICFMIIISIKLNTDLLGIYLIWKVVSIAPSGVHKHFCTISGSRGISKEIFLDSIIPFLFAYISAPWYHTNIVLYSRCSYGSHL